MTRSPRSFLRAVAVALTPSPLIAARRRRRVQRANPDAARRSHAEIFDSIYTSGAWAEAGEVISSGLGSHDATIVEPYVSAVTQFLGTFGAPPDIVDLGCGDFNVGVRIRPFCGRYVACDVSDVVIAHNRRRYVDAGVEFRQLDLTRDALPEGDVIVVRQVLQHLDNAAIATLLPKLGAFRAAVVTEHLPVAGADFTPNRDKPTGAGIRTDLASGVVLHEPPFSVHAAEVREICRVAHSTGTIVTTVYVLD